MSVRLEWRGLDELKAALRELPAHLASEAQDIVFGAADAAAAEIVAAYPSRTGNLRKGVSVKRQTSVFSTTATVINKATHAFIFENGTQARHNKIGANRGSMPPGHVFVPRVVRHRRAMYEGLKDLLEREGLMVTGDAA